MEVLKSIFVNNKWTQGRHSLTGSVFDPATGVKIYEVGFANREDLADALEAAATGFDVWRKLSAYERSKILRKAADLTRLRAEEIAQLITKEQGKPIAEARMEAGGAGDHIDWYAEEGRRAYGRVIPSRGPGVRQMVLQEPVGPVAAFSPWNFPVSQLVRKIAGALAAGCSIIAKGPEEAPSSCMELVRCFEDAGVPAGVVSLVFGVPHEISDYLIRSDVIRKVSFTGSVPVGRLLGALASQYLKRCTLELGGHAPFIVCDDADIGAAAQIASTLKFRNAGQVCAAPTRYIVQAGVYDKFVDLFAAGAEKIVVGSGADPSTQMGPLANARRVVATQDFVADALANGATLATKRRAEDGAGFFYAPTILADVPVAAKVMRDEPFGPVAAVVRFGELEEALSIANGLPFGLAAYAFTGSIKRATFLSDELAAGMVSVNHFGLAAPETPFGGVKDSGYGSEGGVEGLQAYLSPKFISQMGI